MRRFLSGLLLVAWCAAGVPLRAAELGEVAPPLRVSRWVQGVPVDLAASRDQRVVALVFFATWNRLCRQAIPFLNDLHERWESKGVTLVAVSTEPVAAVTEFTRRMRSQMEFPVAVDDNGRTAISYMQAFEVQEVPHVFVIDRDGRVVWRGTPGPIMEKVFENVLEGRHDLAAAQRADHAERLVRQYFRRALLGEKPEDLRALGDRVLEEAAQDPSVLNDFAWIMLTDPSLGGRDLDLATRAARRAYEVSSGKDAAILDTYARALFDTGLRAEAIELQRAAIVAATEPRLRQQLELTLRDYEKKVQAKK